MGQAQCDDWFHVGLIIKPPLPHSPSSPDQQLSSHEHSRIIQSKPRDCIPRIYLWRYLELTGYLLRGLDWKLLL